MIVPVDDVDVIVALARVIVPLFVTSPLVNSNAPVPLTANVTPELTVISAAFLVIVLPLVFNVTFLLNVAVDVSVTFFNTVIVPPAFVPAIACSNVSNVP